MTGRPAGGRWLDLDRPLYVTDVVTCSCCGVMIPRRVWDAGEGLARPYCSPGCRALEDRLALLMDQRGGESPFQSLRGSAGLQAAISASRGQDEG